MVWGKLRIESYYQACTDLLSKRYFLSVRQDDDGDDDSFDDGSFDDGSDDDDSADSFDDSDSDDDGKRTFSFVSSYPLQTIVARTTVVNI